MDLVGLNVAMWQNGKMAGWGVERARSNLRGLKITDSRGVYYGSFIFVKFVLKIAIKREQSHARMNSVERERFR